MKIFIWIFKYTFLSWYSMSKSGSIVIFIQRQSIHSDGAKGIVDKSIMYIVQLGIWRCSRCYQLPNAFGDTHQHLLELRCSYQYPDTISDKSMQTKFYDVPISRLQYLGACKSDHRFDTFLKEIFDINISEGYRWFTNIFLF